MVDVVELFIGYEKIKENGGVPFHIYQYLFNDKKDILCGEMKIDIDMVGEGADDLYVSVYTCHDHSYNNVIENSVNTFTNSNALYNLLLYLAESKDTFLAYSEYYREKIVLKLKQYAMTSDLFYYLLNNNGLNYLIDTKYGFIRYNEKNYSIEITLNIDNVIYYGAIENILEELKNIIDSYYKTREEKEYTIVREIGYMCEDCYTEQDKLIKYKYKINNENLVGTDFELGIDLNNNKCKLCGSNNLAEIDYNLLDIICTFNKKGYKTRFCCESHGNDGDLYISFEDTAEVQVLFGFLQLCKSSYNYYCAEEQYGNYVIRYNTVVALDDDELIDKDDAIRELKQIADSIPNKDSLECYRELMLSVLQENHSIADIVRGVHKDFIAHHLTEVCVSDHDFFK